MLTYQVENMSDWKPVLEALMPRLTSGTILTLSGPLGAGKTPFTQLLAEKFGLASGMKSPTFALMRVHQLPTPVQGISRLVHIDAYRLEKPADALALDLEEVVVQPGTLTIIEWPEQMQTALKPFANQVIKLSIQLEGSARLVTLAVA